MCPSSKCGPLCKTVDPSCNTPTKPYIPNTAIDSSLKGYKGPSDPNCPNKCCTAGNEYCFRTIDNTGNEINIDQEIMLVFGGIMQDEVMINGVSIADNCNILSKSFIK
jgi:hypothetical protein